MLSCLFFYPAKRGASGYIRGLAQTTGTPQAGRACKKTALSAGMAKAQHGKRPVIKGIRLCGRQSTGREDFPMREQTTQKAVCARLVDKQAYKSRGGDSLGRLHCRAVYARLRGRNGRKWFFSYEGKQRLRAKGNAPHSRPGRAQ